MRILLVHNYYGSTAPSGENKVFEAEKAMLEKHGETVATYTRHSDEIRLVVSGWWLVVRIKKIFNLIKGAMCTVGNPFAARALRKKLEAFRPDVVHFHNQFPLISPLAIRAAHKAGCKVVMTLHNYRLVCAGGIPMRDGKVCRDCFKPCRSGELKNWRRRQAEKKVECGNVNANMTEVTFEASSKRGQKKPPQLVSLTEAVRTVVHYQTAAGSNPPNKSSIANRLEARKGVGCGGLSVMPAVKYRCYRGSLLATLPLAINIWLYRHCWAKWVDRFICLTPFARDMMISAGFPASKISVKGNFISATTTFDFNSSMRSGVVFAGRLSPEKGPQVLVEAWNMLGDDAPELTIIGDGDFRAEYESKAKSRKIHFVGQKSHEEVLSAVAAAKLVAIPSMCYEGLPTNLMEAFMLGTPCLASDLGPLPNLVGECGAVFKAGDAKALADAVRILLSRDDWDAMSRACRAKFELAYSEDANYRSVMGIYREVVQ